MLREERVVPSGWEVARGRKTHGLQYGFRIRLPLRREFIVRPLLRVVPAIRGKRCFLFSPDQAVPRGTAAAGKFQNEKRRSSQCFLRSHSCPPAVWGILIAAAAALVVTVVLTCRASSLSTRKMVTIAMLIAVYVVLSLVGTLNLWWIRISVDSLPIILGALLYGPVGGLLVGLLGSLMNQLITYGLRATTVLWVIPAAARGLMIGAYAKKCHFELSSAKIVGVLCVTAVVVTALNTGAMYLDSVINGYYNYAYVFGGVITRVIAGVATALVMSFVAPPVVGMLDRSLRTVRTAQ